MHVAEESGIRWATKGLLRWVGDVQVISAEGGVASCVEDEDVLVSCSCCNRVIEER